MNTGQHPMRSHLACTGIPKDMITRDSLPYVYLPKTLKAAVAHSKNLTFVPTTLTPLHHVSYVLLLLQVGKMQELSEHGGFC